jgi:hypothetical protein
MKNFMNGYFAAAVIGGCVIIGASFGHLSELAAVCGLASAVFIAILG